jgi:hypothetical protein
MALAAASYEIRGGAVRIKRRSSLEANRSERGDVEPRHERVQSIASNDEAAAPDEDSIRRRVAVMSDAFSRTDTLKFFLVVRTT